MLFLLSLFFSPILSAIPPWATGPALVVVGTLMMRSVTKIDWNDFRHAFPAFVTIIIMPFTYSIAYGIIAGLGMHFVIVLVDCIVTAFGRCIDSKNKGTKSGKYRASDAGGEYVIADNDDEEELCK
eukprot:TRINITY_DN10671_c0_g1_i1.p1 TRINITY_DN10671_c0_g1~~TRINITY_DN10671_c0_g1_i1.p1  ORF type:complete len:126 (-),score=16.47 TRINITY_DN10671_c0_g1_i1:50-427(-)